MLPRLWAALRPGGLLAAWWTVFGDPDVSTPLRERVHAISNPEGRPDTRRTGLDTVAWEADLTQGGWFAHVATEVVRWSTDLTATQVSQWWAARKARSTSAVVSTPKMPPSSSTSRYSAAG